MWWNRIKKEVKRFWYESVLGYNKRKKTYRPLDYKFIFVSSVNSPINPVANYERGDYKTYSF